MSVSTPRHPFLSATGADPGDQEQDSTASDDSWMNDPEDYNNNNKNNTAAAGESPAIGGGGGVDGGSGTVKERSSWYRSQFKELENLGKGGFGTVVKVLFFRSCMCG